MTSTKNGKSYPFSERRQTQTQDTAAIVGRQRSRRVARAIASALRPYVERMERRVLLSAYALSNLGQLGINVAGANPHSGLVADSHGNLFGTTFDGGPYSVGTVFEVAAGSNAVTTLVAFNKANGADPYAGVTLDASGNLFGTTRQGGANNEGTVFEIASGTPPITTIVSFDGIHGQYPTAGVTLDSAGDIYGTDGGGTVFEIASGSATLTTIATLSLSVGGYLNGVTLDGAGNLYGTAYGGGAYNNGSVFEVAVGSHTATALAFFNQTNGSLPEAGLTLDSAGDIYGTTSYGGASGYGTVFEIASGTATLTTLASFNLTDGAYPNAVTLDASDNLYGSTGGGYNAVFEIARGSNAITALASYSQTGLVNAESPLMMDAAGDLYGTAYLGGTGGTGAVFEVIKGSNALSVVASFDGTNASNPYGGVAIDGLGNLYGTTFNGGPRGDGTVFEIPAGTNTITPLASFNWTNGSNPETGVTLDSSGNLYGTTQYGGADAGGTVYEIAHGSGAITVLAAFDYAPSMTPAGSLTLDALGNIFGTSNSGGAHGQGTVFEIAKGSYAITTLASFDGTDGASPSSALTLDASGNLYGTASLGGTYGAGVVYEIEHGSGAITTIASFEGGQGQNPQGGVIRDAAGNLYGTTQFGGPNSDGVIFELPSGSTKLTTLAAFNNAAGSKPGPLSLDASGNLYGTTSQGTVFELARGSSTIRALASFLGTNGSNPGSQIAIDARGNLYGTTSNGGPGNEGTVFELAPNTAIALTPVGGANPSSASQQLTFSATVSGGVGDGETVTLVDTTNNNAVVASGTLSGGAARLNVPAGTLLAGTHNLVAVYGGDANFAASQSALYAQTVQVAVTGVAVNGNNPALAGAQRSMVDSIVYTFSEAVNLAAANAFSIAVHAGQSGTVPTLNWTALNPNADGSSSQWVVTFSGAGVAGGSIADGAYDITLNASAATSDANPAVSAQARTDTFFRLYGDVTGDGRVNNADYNLLLNSFNLKPGQLGYLAALDASGTGSRINNLDYNLFLNNFNTRLTGFSATI